MKKVLTIAGSDPTGGAGLQADLRVFKTLGVYGLSVPSSITAQNTEGVSGINEVSSDFIQRQLDALLDDIRPDAIKTGMLYSSDAIRIISEKVKQYSLQNLVIDPVTVSSTGVSLMEDKGLEILKKDLFPLASVITPNIYEASLLTGIEIENEEDAKKAAVKLREFGPKGIIITGGHMKTKAVDMLFDGKEFLTLENEMLDGEYHGTGCVFSSVIAACLALGYDIRESFIKANDFVWNAIKSAFSIGKGMKILNV